MEDALDWISYRSEPGVPAELEKDIFLLVNAVIDPIEELGIMIGEAQRYFQTYNQKHRATVKEIIRKLRENGT